MNRRRQIISIGAVAAVLALGAAALLRDPVQEPASVVIDPPQRIEPVAALGQLEPAGDVLELAAPTAGQPGTPRVSTLFVSEGEAITKGQVLALFDNREGLLADVQRVQAQLRSLTAQISLRQREVSRYATAAEWGVLRRGSLSKKNVRS